MVGGGEGRRVLRARHVQMGSPVSHAVHGRRDPPPDGMPGVLAAGLASTPLAGELAHSHLLLIYCDSL